MRERIIDAALRSMRERGVRATTTKTIARLAGISEGSIYNHFAGRSELVVSALAAATEEIRGHAARLGTLVGENTVAENLEDLCAAVIEFFRDVAPIAGSIMGDPELRDWAKDGGVREPSGRSLTPLTGVVELASYLEREHALGRLPREHPWPVLAATLIGACQQYVYLDLLAPGEVLGGSGSEGPLPPEDYARAVVRILLAP
ncbi:TetR family transcriptional regulator [Allonocardiopsis opalescens]|uniref:TetR family transcriptional regulator n=2 Tax=Allonocardiopsis opalescens TaxID=1144618 RepID=A0A2T0Q205_9ACTN|nr:TetR family transcriptional regulator [Allonocardiopsis opalescens]